MPDGRGCGLGAEFTTVEANSGGEGAGFACAEEISRELSTPQPITPATIPATNSTSHPFTDDCRCARWRDFFLWRMTDALGRSHEHQTLWLFEVECPATVKIDSAEEAGVSVTLLSLPSRNARSALPR
jgi:hypothetical protein